LPNPYLGNCGFGFSSMRITLLDEDNLEGSGTSLMTPNADVMSDRAPLNEGVLHGVGLAQ
jgi:hypothetical protein